MTHGVRRRNASRQDLREVLADQVLHAIAMIQVSILRTLPDCPVYLCKLTCTEAPSDRNLSGLTRPDPKHLRDGQDK